MQHQLTGDTFQVMVPPAGPGGVALVDGNCYFHQPSPFDTLRLKLVVLYRLFLPLQTPLYYNPGTLVQTTRKICTTSKVHCVEQVGTIAQQPVPVVTRWKDPVVVGIP